MKSVLLIGLDNFGIMIAKQLHDLGHEVLAIDKDENKVNAVLPIVTDAQIGDTTKEVFLRSLGINNFDVCIVAIGNDFQSSLETTSLLKDLGGKLVIARADTDIQTKFLLRNGADNVINPEKQMAEWTAVTYTSNRILDYIRLDDKNAIYEVAVPKDWAGKSIGQIDVRKKYGINIIVIKSNDKLISSFTPDTVLKRDQTILVLGEDKVLKKYFKE